VSSQRQTTVGVRMRAGYIEVPGAHLYTVLHEVVRPIARILLVGPFASERHNSYLPWVRWARYLAERRIEVLRFDYRGVGESTGVFEESGFEYWVEDVRLLSDWLRRRADDTPLILHGLEMGALLAAIAFQEGTGDALMLWSPPASANHALKSTLSRRVGLDQMFRYRGQRKSIADYVRQLEEGTLLDVEGYQWSDGLWRDSIRFVLPAAMEDGTSATLTFGKPVRIVELGREAVPLVKGGSVAYDEMKDFTWLFAPNFDWIAATIQAGSRG
jgi:alpha/beta superfamily hydrolase